MERLNQEQLARLVDEPPTPVEQAILDRDPALRRELEAFRSQTEALRNLPAVLPPPGGWNDLERKLLAAGLIRAPRGAPPVWGRWLRAAAAMVLFIGGTAFGWFTASTSEGPDGAPRVASGGPTSFASTQEAKAAVEEAARRWQETYGEYQRLLRVQSQGQAPSRVRDPVVQLAALETLVAAARATVEEFPEDQFFNGVFVSTLAERERARERALHHLTLDSWH